MKKILILHTSVGLGHKYIAENIGWYLAGAGFEVKLEDIGKVQSGKFERYVTAVHQFINRHLPFVWSFLYKWGHYIILPFRVFIAGFNYQTTKKLVDEFQPDLIITVQTTASAVVAYLKKKGLYQGPFGIAFSDFHLHRYWLYKQADFYLANIKEQKEEMIRLGIAPEKIIICGITIKSRIIVNVDEVKDKLHISRQEKVVLIGIGSLGLGLHLEMLNNLREQISATIIVVCGKNQDLYGQLSKYQNQKFIVLGFYQPMAELYAIADVFISKPGGLTTTEGLQWGLPMIVTHFLPGQEELNIKYLFSKKLIFLPAANLVEQVKEELAGGFLKRQLKDNLTAASLIGDGKVLLEAINQVLHAS